MKLKNKFRFNNSELEKALSLNPHIRNTPIFSNCDFLHIPKSLNVVFFNVCGLKSNITGHKVLDLLSTLLYLKVNVAFLAEHNLDQESVIKLGPIFDKFGFYWFHANPISNKHERVIGALISKGTKVSALDEIHRLNNKLCKSVGLIVTSEDSNNFALMGAYRSPSINKKIDIINYFDIFSKQVNILDDMGCSYCFGGDLNLLHNKFGPCNIANMAGKHFVQLLENNSVPNHNFAHINKDMITFPRYGHTLDLIFKSNNSWLNIIGTLDKFGDSDKVHSGISDHAGILANFKFSPGFIIPPDINFSKLDIGTETKAKKLDAALDNSFCFFVDKLKKLLQDAEITNTKITPDNIHLCKFNARLLIHCNLNRLFSEMCDYYSRAITPFLKTCPKNHSKVMEKSFRDKSILNRDLRSLSLKLKHCGAENLKELEFQIAEKHIQRRKLNSRLSKSDLVSKVKQASREIDPSGKKLWDLLHSLQIREKSIITKIVVDGKTFGPNDQHKIADEFAKFFSKAGTIRPFNHNPTFEKECISINVSRDWLLNGPQRSKNFTSKKYKKRARSNLRNVCNTLFSLSEVTDAQKEAPVGKAKGDIFREETLQGNSKQFLVARIYLYNLCWILGNIPCK